MSLLEKTDGLPEAVVKLLRTPAHIEGEVEAILAHATPLTRLVIKAPKHSGVVAHYHSVRTTMQQLSGQGSKKSYAAAREAVLEVANTVDSRTRSAVRRELAAWDKFLEDAGKYRNITVELPSIPKLKLDKEDIALFRKFTE